MAITLNCTTGITTPAETVTGASIVGSIQAEGVTTNIYPIVSGTAVASTSGTSIDFTSIPTWVKRVTVMLYGVSLDAATNARFQIGSGSVDATATYSRRCG